MHNRYTQFMIQQDLSQEVDAAFYEKLQNTTAKKKKADE